MTRKNHHARDMDSIYREIRFPEAIDRWMGHFAVDSLEVAVSNARMTDPVRQKIEDRVWRRIVSENDCVLDLACGRGFYSRRLLDRHHGRFRIFGLDISETVLRIARDESRGISYILGNAERLPIQDNALDVIICITAVEHIENPEPLIAEAARVLKPGGYLYICLHRPFLDPLVLPTAARLIYRMIRRLGSGYKKRQRLGYPGSLGELRRHLRRWLSNAGFELVESGTLLHQMEWGIYRMLAPWAVPVLIRMGRILNRLPLTYYKDLEYWLLLKP